MGGNISWLRWVEHVLAVAGLAWLANWAIEAMSMLIERQRETVKLNRDIRDILKEVWAREQAAAQKAISPEMTDAIKRASSETLPVQWAEEDSSKRQLALAHWSAVVAWRLSKSVQHKDALTEIYTRAAASCIQTSSGVTLDQVRRIARSASRRDPRPTDFNEGLLYDLGALYFYSCRMHVDLMAAAAVTPMLLEEHLNAPAASPEELLVRWRMRVQHELDVYNPTP